MLEFKNPVISYIVNFLLFIWQAPQIITGLIGLTVFHNGELYRNKEAGVTVLKVNKGNFIGGACFSSGPIIFVTPNCDENTIKHETGHSKQSLYLGPLFHILISIPSICLFWYRRLANKDMKFYHSHYPENWADAEGHVDVSKYGL